MRSVVAVIIPTWNNARLTAQCLEALQRQTIASDAEIWVVDNGSKDETLEIIAKEYPEVHVVSLERNLGFSAAANAGIVATSTPLVALLNNDTIPEPRWLEELSIAAARDPEVHLFASLMVRVDAPDVIDAAGDGFALDIGKAMSIAVGRSVSLVPSDCCWVTSPCAGAALYRRTLFEKIGMFDEEFFLGFEDVDLGVRAQNAGYDTLLVPRAVVQHHRGASTMADTPEFTARFFRNQVWVLIKNIPLAPLPIIFVRFLLADRRLRGSFWSARQDYVRTPIYVAAAWGRRRSVQRLRTQRWSEIRKRMATHWRF